MSGPLDRNRLRALFDALSTELREQGHRAHIYIVEGAAMALCFDSRRSTRDVDARISSGHGPVTQAARRIARREGLPESWLNEQATVYMPSTFPEGRIRRLAREALRDAVNEDTD